MYINGKLASNDSTLSIGALEFIDKTPVLSYPSKRVYCLSMDVYIDSAKNILTYMQCSLGLFYVSL
jgi:hypothetical protein